VNLSLGTRASLDAALTEFTVEERARIYPYDSDVISGPQGMMLLEMLRLAAGGADAIDVLARADSLKPGIAHLAGAPGLTRGGRAERILGERPPSRGASSARVGDLAERDRPRETLRYAIRGGRIKLPPPVLKFVLCVGLRFAIRFNHQYRPRDKPKPFGKVPGFDKALPKVRRKVRALIAREVPVNASVGFVVQHTGRADDVREFVDWLRDRYPDARFVLCCYVGATTMIHQGPGAYGVSWMRFDAPQFVSRDGPRVAPSLGARASRARGFRGREDLPTAADARDLMRVAPREVFCLEEGRTFARVHGTDSSRTPVVICAGGTGAALMYDGVAAQLAASYGGRVVIWDRYFQGLSDRLANPRINGPDLWSAQLAQLMERLAMPRVHLVGVSHGSFVAADFAARHPEKVGRVAFVSPVLGGFSREARRKVASARRYPGLAIKLVGKSRMIRKIPGILARCRSQAWRGVGLGARRGTRPRKNSR